MAKIKGMPYSKVLVDGHTLNVRTARMLQCAEDRLGYQLYVVQGSYNAGGVPASAGTHDGGGAMDVSATNNPAEVVHALREVGFAAWHRPYNWDGKNGGEHIHAEAIGDKQLSSGARTQISEYYAGQNGLANHANDADVRVNPIPVWPIKFPTVFSLVVMNQAKTKKPKHRNSVKQIQKALAGRGYYSDSCDGVFGPATARAFKAFTTKRQLAGGVTRGNLQILCKGYNKVL